MSGKINLSKKSLIIISICFVLIAALGFGVFALEFSALSKEKEKLQNQYNKVVSERNDLSSQNAANKSEIDKLNSKNNSLNKKVNSLNKEVSSLKKKLTSKKSAASSKKSTSTKKTNTSKNALKYYKSENKGKKICYLTFDDGPSDNTLKILNILKKGNAKATFFVVGTSKLSYIKKIKEQGHAVALHTNSHDFSRVYRSETAYFKDLEAIHKKVTGYIGEIPLIMRFPGGSSNLVSRRYNRGIMTRLSKKVQAKGYTYVDWNVNSGDADGHNVPASTILRHIKRESKNKNQICVLMHDTDAKDTTVKALPSIISYLRSQGYKFEVLTKESKEFHHGINN